jgi:hypothetical protein
VLVIVILGSVRLIRGSVIELVTRSCRLLLKAT